MLFVPHYSSHYSDGNWAYATAKKGECRCCNRMKGGSEWQEPLKTLGLGVKIFPGRFIFWTNLNGPSNNSQTASQRRAEIAMIMDAFHYQLTHEAMTIERSSKSNSTWEKVDSGHSLWLSPLLMSSCEWWLCYERDQGRQFDFCFVLTSVG